MLLLAVFGCQETPKNNIADKNTTAEPDTARLEQKRGLLALRFGKAWMLDVPKRDTFEVVDQSGKLDSLYKATMSAYHGWDLRAVAALTGKFTRPADKQGARVFDVVQVDSLLAKNPESLNALGIPFEFWCHGNEPFWSIEISKAQGGIFYENISDESGWTNPWIEPKVVGNTLIYELPEMTKGTKPMLLKIKKEKCDDGMSDIQYEYSATLTIEGNTYHGVAIKG